MFKSLMGACLLLMLLSGCGAIFHDNPNSPSTDQSPATSDNTQNSIPDPVPTGQVLVLFAQQSPALSADVVSLRFSLRDAAGQLVFGPETRTVSHQNVLNSVPTTTASMLIEYLGSTDQLVGFSFTPVQVLSGALTTVSDPQRLTPVTSLAIVSAPSTLNVGSTYQLRVLATLRDGSSLDFTEHASWTSSVPQVAVVSNLQGFRGLVNALQPGPVTFTASFGGFSAAVATTVIP